MATTVKEMNLKSSLEVIEDLSKTTLDDDKVTHKLEDVMKLHSGSTPDAELVYSGNIPLVAGAATIDLTALSDSEGNTIATTGKKVRAIKIKPTSTNTGAITLVDGASNGYELFGDGFSIALNGGNHVLAYFGVDAPDIGSSTKNIDLSGTGTESIDIVIVFG